MTKYVVQIIGQEYDGPIIRSETIQADRVVIEPSGALVLFSEDRENRQVGLRMFAAGHWYSVTQVDE